MPGWRSELFPCTQRQDTVAKLAHNPRLLDLIFEDDRLISNDVGNVISNDVGNVKTHLLRSGRRSRLS